MELISIGIERDVMSEIFAFTEIPQEAVDTAAFPLRITYNALTSEKITEQLIEIGHISEPAKRRSFAKTLISRFLYDMTENQTKSNRIPYWLNDLLIEMNKPENFVQGLPRMIELSHVTQNHLNRELKRAIGLTPTEFINEKRTAYAVELLVSQKYAISEVISMTGFETASNFYNNFHKFYGYPPMMFARKQINMQKYSVNMREESLF